MRRTWVSLVALLAIVGTTLGFVAEDSKYTTKEVMNKAHKGGLLKKVMDGKATEADKAKLVEYYEALPHNPAGKGDEAVYKKMCEAMLTAAKAAQKNEKDWKAKLQKATNCKACHDTYK